ncbi:MAG TPA: endonuclease [Acidiferrobacteraceae bacterium]|nr:endonuclease [Acidiferrobacteraceae bacterium]
MVGAVLTQNTAWTNVEKAIDNLKAANSLDAESIVLAHHRRLAAWLRPSGYFNVKARRLRNLCRFVLDAGGVKALSILSTPSLRAGLLTVNGVGPETADDILLYAFNRPVFVIDAYTRRLFNRLGMISGEETYEEMRLWFESSLGADVALYNEYHALIVIQAKDICKKRPLCESCVLQKRCEYYSNILGNL